MWRWFRTLTFRAGSGERPLRAVTIDAGDPYRAGPGTRPAERTPAPRTLEQLIVVVRDAGLRLWPRRRGFDVTGRGDRALMPVRVPDIRRIVPTDLSCGSDEPPLLLDVALALVPAFGPLLVDVPFAGTLFVDGSRDRTAVREEAAERIERVGRRVAMRAPITFPLLVDLARRMRQS